MLIFLLLRVLIVCAIIAFLVTQIWLPIWNSTPWFPAFRMSPLKVKVDVARDEVANLREQNGQLEELQTLLKQKEDLITKIENLEKTARKS